MKKKADERLTITVTQAARMLGISRGLAYEMAREGMIPTLRFGRRLVVPRKAMDRLLQEAGNVNLHRSSKGECSVRRSRNSAAQLLTKGVRPERPLHLGD